MFLDLWPGSVDSLGSTWGSSQGARKRPPKFAPPPPHFAPKSTGAHYCAKPRGRHRSRSLQFFPLPQEHWKVAENVQLGREKRWCLAQHAEIGASSNLVHDPVRQISKHQTGRHVLDVEELGVPLGMEHLPRAMFPHGPAQMMVNNRSGNKNALISLQLRTKAQVNILVCHEEVIVQ